MPLALLDTDILSELIKLRYPIVQGHAQNYTGRHGPLAFSAITRYEVVRGYKHQAATTQLVRFAAFCQQSLVVRISDSILERDADLWVLGRNGGHPNNDADLIIAATALDTGRVLVTGNTSHFAWISRLVLADWRTP